MALRTLISCRPAAVGLAAAMIFSAACGATSKSMRPRPKKHFLSWESLNAHDKMRPWRRITRPEREFEVSRRKVVRLAKPSLWNRKPVQFATPVAGDGQLFVGSTAGEFYAVDIRLNEKNWTNDTEGGIESPAALGGDSVYVGDIKGNVYSFDRKSGRLNWQVSLGNEMLGAPLLVGDRVYFVTLDGRLFALMRDTGAEIWHTDAMERLVGFTVRRQSSPIFYNGMIIYGTSRGTLIAYDRTGQLRWVRLLGSLQSTVMDVDSRPLVVNGKLYAASADGSLFCLDPRMGEILWSTQAGGVNDIIYHDGFLYASGDGVLSAIDPDTGTVVWEQDFETPGLSSPAGGRGYIAVVSTTDKLYLVDQINGDVVFERYIRRGSYSDPVIIDHMLYILGNTARLFSFRIHEKEKDGSTKADVAEEEKGAKTDIRSSG